MPRLLPQSAGWLLEREIGETGARDAMGCYPLFACRDWSQLQSDLAQLEGELASVAVVTDPFGDYREVDLARAFPDVARPFKEHFVVDLTRSPREFIHAHHQRSARKALERLTVERCAAPALFLDEWTELYSTLVARHEIKGLAAFSRESFARQFAVPGLTLLRATHEGRGVGMLLWYTQNGVGYYHLGAYSVEGYELRASFALFHYALEYFAADDQVRWLNLGAGAGAAGDGTNGLTRFKSGWATATRTAYFCGRILERERYAKLVRARGTESANYFPLYRAGEFA